MEDDQADWPPRNRMSYIPEYIWVSDSLPMIPNLPIELAGEERGRGDGPCQHLVAWRTVDTLAMIL